MSNKEPHVDYLRVTVAGHEASGSKSANGRDFRKPHHAVGLQQGSSGKVDRTDSGAVLLTVRLDSLNKNKTTMTNSVRNCM